MVTNCRAAVFIGSHDPEADIELDRSRTRIKLMSRREARPSACTVMYRYPSIDMKYTGASTDAVTVTVRVRNPVSATAAVRVRFRVVKKPSGKLASKNASARARADASCSDRSRPTVRFRAAASEAASHADDSLALTTKARLASMCQPHQGQDEQKSQNRQQHDGAFSTPISFTANHRSHLHWSRNGPRIDGVGQIGAERVQFGRSKIRLHHIGQAPPEFKTRMLAKFGATTLASRR